MGTVKKKLTSTFVANVSADPSKTKTYQDTSKDAYGLMLRVNKGGKKTYYVYGRVKGNNRPQRFTIGDASKIRIYGARELAQEYHALMAEGKHPAKALEQRKRDEEKKRGNDPRYSTTLRQAFENYLTARGTKPGKPNGLSPRTVSDYNETYRRYLSQWSTRRLIDITGEMISEHHSNLTDKGRKRVPDKMASLLRMIFNYAIKTYRDNDTHDKRPLYTYNPVSILDAGGQWIVDGGQSKVKHNAIKRDQLARIWKAIEDIPHYKSGRHNQNSPLASTAYYYFKFILLTGIRPGSAARTEWHQVNISGGFISYTNEDAEKVKGGKEIFELPLSNYVIELLKELHSKRTKNQTYLFPNASGTGHVPVGMNEWAKKICRTAHDIDNATYTAHDYRATFATIADSIGLNEWTIKRLMNHATLGSRDVTSGYIRSDSEVLRSHTQQITNEILKISDEAPVISSELDGFSEDLLANAFEAIDGTSSTLNEVIERWAKMGYLVDSMSDRTTVEKIKKIAAMAIS